MLYDCRTDELFMSQIPWKKETILGYVDDGNNLYDISSNGEGKLLRFQSLPDHHEEDELTESFTFKRQLDILGITPHQGLSILCNLVEPKGASMFLVDERKTNCQKGLVFPLVSYTKSARFRNPSQMTVDFPDALHTTATHFVANIDFGYQMLLTFDEKEINDFRKSYNEELSKVLTQISFDFDENSHLDDMPDYMKSLKCTVYASNTLNPCSMTLGEFTSDWQGNFFKEHAIKIHLLPIQQLTALNTIHSFQIPIESCLEIFDIFDEFQNIETKIKHLKVKVIALGYVREQLDKMYYTTLELRQSFTIDLKEHLSFARGSTTHNLDGLSQHVTSYKRSLRDHKVVLDAYSSQVNTLSKLLADTVKNVSNMSESKIFQRLSVDLERPYTLALVIETCSLALNESEKASIELGVDLKLQIDDFNKCIEVNGDKNLQYAILNKCIGDGKIQARMVLYRYLQPLINDFGPPGRIYVVERWHDYIRIAWSPPEICDMIDFYEVQIEDEASLKSLNCTETWLEYINVKPSCLYRFRCRACYNFVVSPWCGWSDSAVTSDLETSDVMAIDELVNNYLNFEGDICRYLDLLCKSASQNHRQFQKLLERDVFKECFKNILSHNHGIKESSDRLNIGFFMRKLLALAENVEFSQKDDLVKKFYGEPEINVKKKLGDLLCFEMCNRDIAELIENLSTLLLCVRKGKAIVNDYLVSGKCNEFFRCFLRKRSEMSETEMNRCCYYFETLFIEWDSFSFPFKSDLKREFLYKDLNERDAAIETFPDFIERIRDIQTRCAHRNEKIINLSFIRSAFLLTLKRHKNFAEQTLLSILLMQFNYSFAPSEGSTWLHRSIDNFLASCEKKYKDYMDVCRNFQSNTENIYSHLLLEAVNVIGDIGKAEEKIHMYDIDSFMMERFYEIFEHLKEECQDRIYNAVCKYLNKDIIDFKRLKEALTFLKLGDLHRFDEFDRLVIPRLVATPEVPNVEIYSDPAVKDDIQNMPHFCGELVQELCRTFGLDCSKSITLHDVMVVGSSECTPTLKITEVPYSILKKILMADFKGRESPYDMVNCDILEDDKDPVDYFSDSQCVVSLNVLDGFLVIFNKCDPFLKQALCEKLFACKLAVPFLYPDISGKICISSWAFQSIILGWSVGEEDLEKNALSCPIDIISCIRFQRPLVSKSNVLNHVLYADGDHNTFFYRDCSTTGFVDKIFTNGMIEAAWSLPSRKKDCSLEKPTLFLNLRGDGYDFSIPIVNYLDLISSIIMIFADIEEMITPNFLNQIAGITCKQIIFVVLCKNFEKEKTKKIWEELIKVHDLKNMIPGFTPKGIRLPEAKLVEKIRKKINTLANLTNKCSLKDTLTIARNERFHVDGDCQEISNSENAAKQLIGQFAEIDLPRLREMLSVQGFHWYNYTNYSKKMFSKYFVDQKQKLCRAMSQERHSQLLSYIESVEKGSFMKLFLQQLVEYATKKDSSMSYYIQWMRLLLDEHTREQLPKFAKEYFKMVQLHQEEKSKCNPDDRLLKKLKKLEISSEKALVESSLGIEHLLREVGQIYECIIEYISHFDSTSLQSNTQCYRMLPVAAAQILLSGFPLELMDGDVSNIPLVWIKAVLNQVVQLVGDKKIYILGIIGIQSSGKSTLLNTMFGLKFPVCAGRCTRGVFMQLVPVRHEDFSFDYFLVVDTEGLRSPELQLLHQDHDNKLATLVIGLCDMTIFNAKGQDLSGIRDILEIAVYNFLRMKVVNKSLDLFQSCIFVHQNASSGGNEKRHYGHKKLQDTLDEMTAEAGRLVLNDENLSFKNIINYNEERHIRYFSDLHKGDPPMAPVNPSYSDCASELRDIIISDFASTKKLFFTFDTFGTHLQNLWQAILSGESNFHFKNCLEMRAYHYTEKHVCELQLKLEKFVTSLIKDLAYNFENFDEKRQLDDYSKTFVQVVDDKIRAEGSLKLEKLKEFFMSEEMQLFSLWQDSVTDSFKNFIEDLKRKAIIDVNRLCDDFAMRHKEMNKIDSSLIIQHAQRFLHKNFTDSELQDHFDDIWRDMVTGMEAKEDHRLDVKKRISNVLERHSSGPFLNEQLKKHDISEKLAKDSLIQSFSQEEIEEGDLRIVEKNSVNDEAFRDDPCQGSQNFSLDMSIYFSRIQRRIFRHIQCMFREIDINIATVDSNPLPFQDSFMSDIVQIIHTHCQEKIAMVIKDQKSTLTKTLEITVLDNLKAKIIVLVGRYCCQQFEMIEDKYAKVHGIQSLLSMQKARMLSLFIDTVHQLSDSHINGRIFWNCIVEWIQSYILKEISGWLASHVKDEFGMRKFYLLKCILIDLADGSRSKEDSFQDYIGYIQNSYGFALRWMTQHINKMYFSRGPQQSKCEEYCEGKLISVMNDLEITIQSLSDKTYGGSCSPQVLMKHWCTDLCARLSKNHKISIGHFELLIKNAQKRFDLTEFQNYILSSRRDITDSVRAFFKTIDSHMAIKMLSPKDIVDSLWGCKSQCPFCKEPCCLMNHDASVRNHLCLQHRPQGIGGQFWLKHKQMVLENCNMMVNNTKLKFSCLCRSVEEVLFESMNLDIVFVMDATGSMQKYIEKVKSKIGDIVRQTKDFYLEAVIRVAVVAYRDYSDKKRVEVLPFTNNIKHMVEFLSGIKAKGGGRDAPEDVLSGLEEASNLCWAAENRLLFHFGDQPCHGSRFNDAFFDHDRHCNKANAEGLNIQNILAKLTEERVKYIFGRITSSTDKMIAEFQKISGNNGFPQVMDASSEMKAIELIPEVINATLQKKIDQLEFEGESSIRLFSYVCLQYFSKSSL